MSNETIIGEAIPNPECGKKLTTKACMATLNCQWGLPTQYMCLREVKLEEFKLQNEEYGGLLDWRVDEQRDGKEFMEEYLEMSQCTCRPQDLDIDKYLIQQC